MENFKAIILNSRPFKVSSSKQGSQAQALGVKYKRMQAKIGK